jgi:hypothetical protein
VQDYARGRDIGILSVDVDGTHYWLLTRGGQMVASAGTWIQRAHSYCDLLTSSRTQQLGAGGGHITLTENLGHVMSHGLSHGRQVHEPIYRDPKQHPIPAVV